MALRIAKIRIFAYLLIAAATVLGTAPSCGDGRLPRLIGDGMVLQRDARISVGGRAAPGEKVRLDFHGDQATAKADNKGYRSVSLGPNPAARPCNTIVAAKKSVWQSTTFRSAMSGSVPANRTWSFR
jgi:hypothetical protein